MLIGKKNIHLGADIPMLSIPVDGQQYAIAMLPEETDGFPLTFNGKPGEYTLSVNSLEIKDMRYAHLIDLQTGADIDLLRQPSYTFHQAGNSAIANRFAVRFSALHPQFAFLDGDRIIVNGEGTLCAYDVMGRLLFSKELSADALTYLHTNAFPSAGVYVLRLGEKSQKIVIK